MRRIILDFIWRKKWTAIWLPILALNRGVLRQPESDHGLLAAAFYLYLFMFVLMTNMAISVEMNSALFVLPISRKQRGAVAWSLTVIVPALLALCAKCLAGVVGHVLFQTSGIDWSWILFSTLFDVAFIGALASPWILSLSPGGILGRLLIGGWVAVLVAGWWVMGRFVPTGWHELNIWSGLALLAGLAITAAGYRQSSRLGVLGGVRRLRDVERPTSFARPTRRSPGNRLSSVRRILWAQFGIAIASAVLLLAGLAIVESVFNRQWNVLDSLRRLVPLTDLGRAPLLPFLLIGFLTVASVSTRSLQIAIRALRVMPLSTWELNAVLIARLAITWPGYWLVLATADLLLAGRAPAFAGLEIFAGLFGATCLANAAALRWQSPASLLMAMVIAGFTMGMGFAAAGPRLLEARFHLEGRILHPAALLGMACLIAAAYWNHRLLTRSSVIYKRTTLFPESA
jgi:hypothetical protein